MGWSLTCSVIGTCFRGFSSGFERWMPTQVDSQPDTGEVGQVFDPTAPAPLNPGPFESCDEDMLFDASEGEDEGEACRSNGI